MARVGGDSTQGKTPMAVKKGEPGKLAEGRELEVKHLAETTDLSPKQARDLLEKYGNDFERIRKEAKNFKAES
jgi:hypothetical protein